MNLVTGIMLCFSVLGALDCIAGNRFGLGKEFEKGIKMMGTMMLSMTGMIIIAPYFANAIQLVLKNMSDNCIIDPSVIPSLLLANDMGGALLSIELAQKQEIGNFNAFVVSSMMGCTISFTIPFAMGSVEKESHKELLIGLMCGIITIPIGCFVAGIVCGLPIMDLTIDLLPLLVLSVLLACGLAKKPELCVKIFKIVGRGISILITIGLLLGILQFAAGIEFISGLSTLEEGTAVCLNASVTMTGAFPLMHILSRILKKPLLLIGEKININTVSSMGILASLATSVTTFSMMKDMDKKGIVLNASFAVSGAFVFAGHLAFTLAFNEMYIGTMIVGKLVAGILGIILANYMYEKLFIRKERK